MTAYSDILTLIISKQVNWTPVAFLALLVFSKTSSGIFENAQKIVTVFAHLLSDIIALIFNFVLILKNKKPLLYYHSGDVFYVGDRESDLVQYVIEDPSYDEKLPLDGGSESREKRDPDFLPLTKGYAQRKQVKK